MSYGAVTAANMSNVPHGTDDYYKAGAKPEDASGASGKAEDNGDHYSLEQLKKKYSDYVSVKFNEIDEQRTSWRYYHSVQWTAAEIAILNTRKQTPITFNRATPKINGLVGTIVRLRADPKAFPVGPQGDDDAEVATLCLREVCDSSRWKDIEPLILLDAAVHGYGIVELGIEPGDKGDPDITINQTDCKTFFYDPRSLKADFSDARYLGVSRWADIDEIEEIVPNATDKIKEQGNVDGNWTLHDTDRAFLWFNQQNQYRLNEIWYKMKGRWYYCIYVGNAKLAHGPSPFYDERNRSVHRYIGFTCGIDQDGDRYGFMRILKGPQDALNQHRTKAQWIMNTRQITAEQGAFANIEETRREAARPDGIIIRNKGFEAKIEAADQEFLQQTEYFKEALQLIETFGPSVALVGETSAKSGRALSILQQSGLAELGPFLASYQAAKLRMYRNMWQAVRMYWKAERWLRVTDDPKSIKFVPINKPQVINAQQTMQARDPGVPPPMPNMSPDQIPQQAMQPIGNGNPAGTNVIPFPIPYMVQTVNNVSALNVDIVIEEGPDTANVMGDVFDILMALVQNHVSLPPQLIIEVSALPSSQKKKLIEMMSQPPSQEQQQDTQLNLAGKEAEVEHLKAKTDKLRADTDKTAGPDTAKTRAEAAHRFAQIDHIASSMTVEHKLANSDRLTAHTNAIKTFSDMMAPKETDRQPNR
jgi:hypothetical protein